MDFDVFFLEADLKKAQMIENHHHNSWNRAKPFLNREIVEAEYIRILESYWNSTHFSFFHS